MQDLPGATTACAQCSRSARPPPLQGLPLIGSYVARTTPSLGPSVRQPLGRPGPASTPPDATPVPTHDQRQKSACLPFGSTCRCAVTERDVDWVNLRNAYPPSEWVSPEIAQHALIAPHSQTECSSPTRLAPGKEPPTRTPTGCSASASQAYRPLPGNQGELLAVQTRFHNRPRN